MDATINAILGEIQAENDIKILSAREMGSRLMGVANEESDWDVMFIYAFEEPWKYAALGHSKQSMDIERGDIDLHGWNIDKFAKHLSDSNPQAMEFLQARAYREAYAGIWRDLEDHAIENMCHMSLYHHYISLAKGNYKKYVESGNDRSEKRQFYVARAIACASHIRIAGEMPPMDANTLVEEGEMNDELRGVLRKLTLAKRDTSNEEQPDLVGELYAAESGAPMQHNDERTRYPENEQINKLVKAAL